MSNNTSTTSTSSHNQKNIPTATKTNSNNQKSNTPSTAKTNINIQKSAPSLAGNRKSSKPNSPRKPSAPTSPKKGKTGRDTPEEFQFDFDKSTKEQILAALEKSQQEDDDQPLISAQHSQSETNYDVKKLVQS
ncbi:unnamed protein product [Cylicocyclus nassatus]|uniref:Uncharacterized protein n=1 Tax=Cylicocyclus nassatus TaxID=53992 RepID=A0AA36H2N1_CYLNA|nr:unnamed protein product [Cylicocyclus nassatus]